MGVRLTVRHRYDFGGTVETLDANGWDALRRTSGPFGMHRTPAELRANAERMPGLADRAGAISRLSSTVASYGVGGGNLERLLADRDVKLTCGEYAPRTVERLRLLLPEADIRRHDLRTDGPLPGDLHLFHRIETELDDDQWRAVYRRFAHCRVLVIPDGILRLRDLPRTLVRNGTDAGWLRTRSALQALWADTHVGQRTAGGWLLEPC